MWRGWEIRPTPASLTRYEPGSETQLFVRKRHNDHRALAPELVGDVLGVDASLAIQSRKPWSSSIGPGHAMSGGRPPRELRGCLMIETGIRYHPRPEGRLNGPTDSPNTSFWPDASPTWMAPILLKVFMTTMPELKQPAS